MWSFQIFSLSVMAAGVLSQHAPDSGSGTQPLCVAKEWQGGQAMMTGAHVNGKRIVTKSTTYVFYSAVKQKILAQQIQPDYNIKLFDFPAGVQYTVTYPDPSGKAVCARTPLTTPFKEQCIPENYTITVDPHTTYGAGNYVTYGWEARGELDGLTYHVTMTNDFLPMFEEIYGIKDEVPFFQNLFFFNASVVQLSPAVFRVPDSCTHLH